MPKDLHSLPDASSFWNLEDLVPRRASPRKASPKPDTATVEISVPTVVDAKGERENIFTKELYPDLKPEKPLPELVYRPERSLLREVRIYSWKTEYAYYEQFCRQAHRFVEVEGTETAPIPFFSYMPQYSQMNKAQLSYYFWWRTNFRRGVHLEADYAYLLLYLYEQINLGANVDPQKGQKNMLRLWLGYRDKYPHLDTLMREWLPDYSLLHCLPPPLLPSHLFCELIAECRLKEFFIVQSGENATVDATLAFCSNYDYKKSKFYRKEVIPVYDRVLRDAVRHTLAFLRQKHVEHAHLKGGYSTITRDAFSGAICSYRLKKRIEIDYTSFSHTHALRYMITDVLKYAENAIRASYGIKSRLTVYDVSGELRTMLDAYLKEALPKRAPSRPSAVASVPAYEKRYDLPITPLSLEKAAAIEADSWQTTKRLMEAFEDNLNVEMMCRSTSDVAQTTYAAEDVCKTDDFAVKNEVVSGNFAKKLGDLAEFIALADKKDRAAQRAFATKRRMMVDAVADCINTEAGDYFGDVLLEEVDGVYELIADYRELMIEEGILI